MFLGLRQITVRHEMRVLLRGVVALGTPGPTLRQPPLRPVVVGVLGQLLGQLQKSVRQLHLRSIDRSRFVDSHVAASTSFSVLGWPSRKGGADSLWYQGFSRDCPFWETFVLLGRLVINLACRRDDPIPEGYGCPQHLNRGLAIGPFGHLVQ